jgi:penicillin-binding protein 1A
MIKAILSAEDERFYEHQGIDYIGLTRAVIGNITGKQRSGASTITMQVAKNFFLSPEQTLSRKFTEVLLAYRIEKTLTKNEILELYINQIYLGQRAYGFQAASFAYYKKPLNELSLAQIAMLAGLPKAPSAYNPISNFPRASLRKTYVLRRMHELNFITSQALDAANADIAKPVVQAIDTVKNINYSQYVAEMARKYIIEHYGEAAYISGLSVTTTVTHESQEHAFHALRDGLIDYDKRYGSFAPPEFYVDPALIDEDPKDSDILARILDEHRDTEDIYLPAIVLNADKKNFSLLIQGGEIIKLNEKEITPIAHMLSPKTPSDKQVKKGALLRVKKTKTAYALAKLPAMEAAFVAIDPSSGEIQALVGGFDYNRSSFNRVTQAYRQPGSSFKPFIYSAGLSKGFTAGSRINDEPISIKANGRTWQPKNDDGRFFGPITMRYALTQSRNMVSIRILQAITPTYAQEYLQFFGFKPENHPPYLTMALGAGSVTPLEMAVGYSVFANQGYRITPYFIEQISNADGQILFQAQPKKAGVDAPQAIDPRNAFIMSSMLGDVVKYGTATAAKVLNRNDIGGKTGTTNESKDAWFAGISPYSVGIAWVGHDNSRSLGKRGYGGVAALPIWINYMKKALKDKPDLKPAIPKGVTVISGAGLKGGPEYFLSEFPINYSNASINEANRSQRPASAANRPNKASASNTTNAGNTNNGTSSTKPSTANTTATPAKKQDDDFLF